MTYLDILNYFYDFCECNTVSANAQLLFYTLLGINNKCAWEEWFSRTNISLSTRMGISEKAFIRERNELKQLGLIDFISSKKRGTCTKYRILYRTKDSTKEVQKKYKGSTKEVQKADINRYKTETNKKDIPEGISKKVTRFVPPTVEEVRAYCEERHNDVDPEKFVAFYDSKGWMIGKNKMKSWKSAVITWEGRGKKVEPQSNNLTERKTNAWNNFEQRDYGQGFYDNLEGRLTGNR